MLHTRGQLGSRAKVDKGEASFGVLIETISATLTRGNNMHTSDEFPVVLQACLGSVRIFDLDELPETPSQC